jgi:aminopeptidase YwaD
VFRAILGAVQGEFSGQAAKDQVAAISQYHRIQASPGYRAAARHCLQYLQQQGVSAEVLSYPATNDTSFWSEVMFQEWDASDARLYLIGEDGTEKKLADYRELKLSVIQRSAPFDGEAEVVILEDGEAESDYEGLDVAGKAVLTKGDIRRVYDLAVAKRGAVGILYDGMRPIPPVREAVDLPDTRQYASFWWIEEDTPCFGFVLTPRQGLHLRNSAKKRAEAVPRVRAHVASKLYDGNIEVVSAVIPGKTDEEVVLTAHLCHPQPSCNDNASGSAVALETARTLHSLIQNGTLAQPVRSIRFLWVPEMTGTYAYLASHEDEIPRMVAGLNLDMVGENQDFCKASFVIEQPPVSMPSFVSALAVRIREELIHGAQSIFGIGGYPLFRHAVTPFTGGSDHYILSDPTVGVPTPMLIQWPDKFWHTSDDTLEKVDPAMLAVVGVLSSTYAYFLADAEADEAVWLGHEMMARYKGQLAKALQGIATDALGTEEGSESGDAGKRTRQRADFMLRQAQQAVASLTRLSPEIDDFADGLEQELERFTAAELGRALEVVSRKAGPAGVAETGEVEVGADEEWQNRAQDMVPERVFRGPIGKRTLRLRLGQDEWDAWYSFNKERGEASRTIPIVALYWADGQRNLREIAHLVELETGHRDLELLVRYFELLARHGFVVLKAGE